MMDDLFLRISLNIKWGIGFELTLTAFAAIQIGLIEAERKIHSF